MNKKVTGEVMLAEVEQRNAKLVAIAKAANESYAKVQAVVRYNIEELGALLQQAYEVHLHSRDTGWRKWCEQELDMSYKTADKIRLSALVLAKLDDVRHDQLPTTLAQCQMLARVGIDNVPDAWKVVLANHYDEDVTPADIKNTLAKVSTYAKAFRDVKAKAGKARSTKVSDLKRQIENLPVADRDALITSLAEGANA